jgi:hypothetical protein
MRKAEITTQWPSHFNSIRCRGISRHLGAGSRHAEPALCYFACVTPAKCETVAFAAAGVAELADALDSKSSTRKGVWVRAPPPAPLLRPSASSVRDLCQIFRLRRSDAGEVERS